jgi:hypothetical protein
MPTAEEVPSSQKLKSGKGNKVFICKKCLERYEGPAIDLAKSGLGLQSHGRCEVCERGRQDCFDIPSSANWRIKKRKPVKRKKALWIGTAQVLVDVAGHARAVLVHEDEKEWLLIGPIGCLGEGVNEMLERRGTTEQKMKKLIEKELRKAGY